MNIQAPLFVVGCPRSGTSYLGRVLFSAGGFVRYQAESHFYDMVVPRFGNLRSGRQRERLLDWWKRSRQFERSGLDIRAFSLRVRAECRSDGDFIRLFMGSMAEEQGVSRWIDTTPAHLLHMGRIKRALPDARFIHIIRDGRDVALSLSRMGWAVPPPWDRRNSLLIAAWSWAWEVRYGRRLGRRVGGDYIEVRFEDLIAQRDKTVAAVSEFANCDFSELDELTAATARPPNTSFPEELKGGAFNPVGRWKVHFPTSTLRLVEATIGHLLHELGYETQEASDDTDRQRASARHQAYDSFRAVRHQLKRTVLSRYFAQTDFWRTIRKC